MINPEESPSPESKSEVVRRKVEQLLDSREPYEVSPSFIGSAPDNRLLNGVVKVVRGEKLHRIASVEIGAGWQWVAISEFTTKRPAHTRTTSLTVSGDMVADSEGRNIDRLWHFDLLSHDHDATELTLLDRLLDAPEEDRPELFKEITEYQRAKRAKA